MASAASQLRRAPLSSQRTTRTSGSRNLIDADASIVGVVAAVVDVCQFCAGQWAFCNINKFGRLNTAIGECAQ